MGTALLPQSRGVLGYRRAAEHRILLQLEFEASIPRKVAVAVSCPREGAVVQVVVAGRPAGACEVYWKDSLPTVGVSRIANILVPCSQYGCGYSLTYHTSRNDAAVFSGLRITLHVSPPASSVPEALLRLFWLAAAGTSVYPDCARAFGTTSADLKADCQMRAWAKPAQYPNQYYSKGARDFTKMNSSDSL